LATSVREKSLNGNHLTLQESGRILSDYAGLLSFSVVLFGNHDQFAKNAIVYVKQQDKTIPAYQKIIPVHADRSNLQAPKNFTVQCYFYFLEKEINLGRPVTLVIITGDKNGHKFTFDLNKIK
jgi:hypothetical protein